MGGVVDCGRVGDGELSAFDVGYVGPPALCSWFRVLRLAALALFADVCIVCHIAAPSSRR